MSKALSELCPEFAELEAEVIQEFYSDVKDCVADINNCQNDLEQDSSELVNRLFRSIHTIKGNCNMVFLEPFVQATHLIEEVVQDIRNGRYPFHKNYCLMFIAGINAIDEQLQVTMTEQIINTDLLAKITELFAKVRDSTEANRVDNAKRAELAIQDQHFSLDLVAVSQLEDEAFSIFAATDMEFFHYLSDCQLAIDPDHSLRMNLQIDLVKTLNTQLDRPADEQQLLAALYVYEFFAIVKGHDEHQIRRRVFSGGSMLARIPGWEEASNLIFQTHETLDGSGFPRQLAEEQILSAAKLIHLAELFVSTALFHRKEGYKQSLFVAVKKINALKGLHYKQGLIERFNALIKETYLTQIHW